MLTLIARRHGAELANLVADQMIHTSIRSDKDAQRLSIPTRIGVRHPKLATVIAQMEAHIEDPVSPADLARGGQARLLACTGRLRVTSHRRSMMDEIPGRRKQARMA